MQNKTFSVSRNSSLDLSQLSRAELIQELKNEKEACWEHEERWGELVVAMDKVKQIVDKSLLE